MAKTKFKFSNFCFSHRLHRGSEVTLGSEDKFQFFYRAYLFRRGQVEHVLTMANLKLNLIYLRPTLVRGMHFIISKHCLHFLFVSFCLFGEDTWSPHNASERDSVY